MGPALTREYERARTFRARVHAEAATVSDTLRQLPLWARKDWSISLHPFSHSLISTLENLMREKYEGLLAQSGQTMSLSPSGNSLRRMPQNHVEIRIAADGRIPLLRWPLGPGKVVSLCTVIHRAALPTCSFVPSHLRAVKHFSALRRCLREGLRVLPTMDASHGLASLVKGKGGEGQIALTFHRN